MVTCVFLLGRPGSGKSAAARHIGMFAQQKGWSVERVNDYAFLEKMAHDDATKHLFRIPPQGGVDVLDPAVLDIALKFMIQQIESYIAHASMNTLVIIEFARSDYDSALAQFPQEARQHAHVLFIDAEIELCRQRIHERCKAPMTEDDHPLSDYALLNYYEHQYLSNDKVSHVEKILNQGPAEIFYNLVNQFVSTIL